MVVMQGVAYAALCFQAICLRNGNLCFMSLSEEINNSLPYHNWNFLRKSWYKHNIWQLCNSSLVFIIN